MDAGGDSLHYTSVMVLSICVDVIGMQFVKVVCLTLFMFRLLVATPAFG